MSPQPVFLLRLQPDARLVRLARRGHAEAFEAIVLRYRGPLLAFCRRMLRGDAAQDVAQETFIRAWQALERGTEVRELRAWLFTIARRLALRELAARGAQPEELVEAPSIDACPDAELERRATVGQVLSAVAALPEDQRDALVWTEMEGRSRRDIAAELGVSEGAVRQLVYRARGALRTAVMGLTPGPLLARVMSRGGRQPLIAELLTGGASHAAPAAVGAVAAVVVAATIGAGAVSLPDVDPEPATKPVATGTIRHAEAGSDGAHPRVPASRQLSLAERRERRARRGPSDRRRVAPRAHARRPRGGDRRAGDQPGNGAPVAAPSPSEPRLVEARPTPPKADGGMGGNDAAVKPPPERTPGPVDAPAPDANDAPPGPNYLPPEPNDVPAEPNYVPPEPDSGGDYVPDVGPAGEGP